MASVLKPMEWALGRFSTDMGIDLGTANTLVSVRGQGIKQRIDALAGQKVVLDDAEALAPVVQCVGHAGLLALSVCHPSRDWRDHLALGQGYCRHALI